MSKITELNATDTYRLVDVDGYKNSDGCNSVRLLQHPEILTGFKLDEVIIGMGLCDGTEILDLDECHLFEKVDIETVKPEVAYYIQIGYRGRPYKDAFTFSLAEVAKVAEADIGQQIRECIKNPIKSKFKPVYKK